MARIRSQRFLRALAAASLLLAAIYLPPLPAALVRARQGTQRLYDAHGGLLRELTIDGVRAQWEPLAAQPPLLLAALRAAEDRHLAWHPGVDPIGVGRALWLN